jgi:hypothetical protein
LTNEVRCTGKAIDLKFGAACTKKGELFFVGSLYSWDDNFVSRRVIIKGDSIFHRVSKYDSTKIYQYESEQFIIINPRYRKRMSWRWHSAPNYFND